MNETFEICKDVTIQNLQRITDDLREADDSDEDSKQERVDFALNQLKGAIRDLQVHFQTTNQGNLI